MRFFPSGMFDDDPEMRYGLIGAIALHILVALLLIYGLPSIWNPEVIEEPIAVKLATLSDISAAPKTQIRDNKKPEKKPDTPSPEKTKPEPPKPAKAEPPPPAPAAPPPPEKAEAPPPPEKKPEAIPEKKPEKKPEQKKPEEKKPDQKKQQQDFNSLLQNVLKTEPAPSKEEAPKKSKPAPAEPSSGPQTDQISEIPMTATEEDGIRAQIETHWNIDPGSAGFGNFIVELRISMNEDGTVTKVELLNNQPGNPVFVAAAESARRAVLQSSPLKIPTGKYWPTMVLRFNPTQISR